MYVGYSHIKNYDAKDVDGYIASAASGARPILEELRKLIKTTVPAVEEGISWGVPWYRYHGMLAGFAAYKNHVSFGPAWSVPFQNKDQKILKEKGYKTGSKIIQIRFDQKVPTAIIKQIIKAQSKINEAKRELK